MRLGPRFAVALVALVPLIAGCDDAPSFSSNCTAGAPSAEVLRPAERHDDGSVILPDGRKLTPAGAMLTVGGFPLALRMLPQAGQRYVVVSDGGYGDEHLRIADTQAPAGADPIVANVDYVTSDASAHDPALFYGLALDETRGLLYVSDGGYDPGSRQPGASHYNLIEVFDVSANPPTLNQVGQIKLAFSAAGQRLPAGLALSRDGNRLYVACQGDGTLAVVDVDPNSGSRYLELGTSLPLGTAPYDVALDEAAHTAFVTLWGGQSPGVGSYADGVVPVDIFDPAQLTAGALIATDKAPEQTLLVDGTLYVAAADGDAIARVDVAARTAARTATGLDPSGLVGSSPNALARDAANDRLYVANAGENAVQAFQLSTMTSLGRIPTAWYPTAVAVRSDGSLVIASAKGLGAGPSDHSPGKNDYMQGTLEILPAPSPAELTAGDATVRANLLRPRDNEVPLSCNGAPQRFPLPTEPGAPTPLQHVFLIVRENKTYDAVLGDLDGTNGRRELVMFGEEVTPNLHALARRFANLDNFYSLAEQSLQGHEWTTANMANDYTEKAWLTTWGRAYRSITAFGGGGSDDHLGSPARTVWSHLDAAHLAYHNYGEITNTTGAIHIYDNGYPGIFFNTDVLDVDKIQYVVDNLKDRRFVLEPFSYIGLPNDHTVGTQPGKPTPQSMVADNDEATGRFVDALSRSSYWSSSIVFVIEDDPQDGGDHVEIHRSPCVVISPWVKHGYTSHVHYDVPAMWKTITHVLGVPPINQRDAYAAAMYDLFATRPDGSAYTVIPRKVPPTVSAADAPMAKESMAIDFSRPDRAPLGRILWKATHGRDAEPPWGPRPLVHQHDDDDD
jgi:DNA-binding beta-propeller fold protein YncE